MLFFLMLSSLTVMAQIDRSCLEEQSFNFGINSRIKLVMLDSAQIIGRLLRIDFEKSLILINYHGRFDSTITVPFDSLQQVEFSKGVSARAFLMLGGFLAGSLIWMDKKDGEKDEQYWSGFFASGLAGAFICYLFYELTGRKSIRCGTGMSTKGQ
ncbi:MAG: hypothetical protein ACOYVF_08700 [Candidatus Zixiibacteriota bacterium]